MDRGDTIQNKQEGSAQIKQFEGKKVLITGGSRGIGFATAKRFIEAGAKVLITGPSESVYKAAERLGECAVGFVWDVMQVEMIAQKFQEAVMLLGGLDIVINHPLSPILRGRNPSKMSRKQKKKP